MYIVTLKGIWWCSVYFTDTRRYVSWLGSRLENGVWVNNDNKIGVSYRSNGKTLFNFGEE